MKKISVSLSGHSTSVTLEGEFIDALRRIALADKTSVAAIINSVDAARDSDANLSSALRVYIIRRLLRTAKL